jgi:hypothetical protein
MISHYDLKRNSPELFTKRDVHEPEIKQCLENQYYFSLPPTKDNHIVCYHAFSNKDPKEAFHTPLAKCLFMMTGKLKLFSCMQLVDSKK